MISVIIPIYNRKFNLMLVLAALDKQSVKDFEIIIADDGSSDSPLETARTFEGRLSLKYVWHEHDGFRLSLIRNTGAKLATGDAFLFLDSDILLNPTAMGHYANLYKANPTAIIGGRYDWMEPMEISLRDVYHNWGAIIGGRLPRKDPGGPLVGIIGIDPRKANNPYFFDSSERGLRSKYCLSLFAGNILVPASLFWALGGWDERMTGHGGEDAEFAMRAQAAHIKALFSEEVVGYHIYHWRDQERNEKEVSYNINYIASKHDLRALGIRLGSIRDGELPLVYREGEEHYV